MNSPFQRYSQSELAMIETELSARRLKELSCDDEQALRKLREFPYGDDWAPRRKHDRHDGNGDSECTCGLPNKKYCMLTSVSKKGHSHRKKIVWAPMSICKVFSSSTPTVPYSTADILYGNEVNGGRRMSNEDARQNSFGESEKSKEMMRQRSKELELNPNNRRPSSKSGRKKSISIDSVTPFDKDGVDTLKNLSSALPPTKPTHHFRPNGIRSSMVKTETLYSSTKTNGASTGRDQDDLVAMGTLWSPNNNTDRPPQVASSSGALSSLSQQPPPGGSSRNNSTSNTNTNSFPSKVVSSSSSVNNSMSSSNNTLNTQRKYPGNSVRPIVVQNNVSGKKNSNSMKEQEDPKYTDPLIGAHASFQQRIIELGALEGDTVRWERTKRLKKKKQDRDS